MNSKSFEEINQINKDFYRKVGVDFDRTRQRPWKGWERVIEEAKKHFHSDRTIKIADLGCGNGRFLKYLLDINFNNGNFSYTGYDTDDYLISRAKDIGFEKSKFINLDIITNINKINAKYDFVVSFGLTHHMPKNIFENWLNAITNISNDRCLFALSFWKITEKIPHNDKLISDHVILSWREIEIERYCYVYKKSEIINIIGRCNQGISAIYDRDDNIYVVFKMTNYNYSKEPNQQS